MINIKVNVEKLISLITMVLTICISENVLTVAKLRRET